MSKTLFEYLQSCTFDEFAERVQMMICSACEQSCDPFPPSCYDGTKEELKSKIDLEAEKREKEEARQKAEDAELEQDAMKILAVWWSTREG